MMRTTNNGRRNWSDENCNQP